MTVTRPAANGIIVQLFLNVLQTIASVLQVGCNQDLRSQSDTSKQIRYGVAYLVRDIVQSGFPRSDPLNVSSCPHTYNLILTHLQGYVCLCRLMPLPSS